MRVLVVSATEAEIPRLRAGLRGRHQVDLMVTGVGMVATAAQAARAMTRISYDMAFNVGVCGAFDRSLALGDVVHVTADGLAELGAEDGEQFIPVEALGLGAPPVIENVSPPANAVLRGLPRVRGITVNTVHGADHSIAAVVRRLNPQVESMEGAAFAYACMLCGVPYAQVRAVSNYVERRNRNAWRLDLAIDRLNDTAARLLDAL